MCMYYQSIIFVRKNYDQMFKFTIVACISILLIDSIELNNNNNLLGIEIVWPLNRKKP